MFIHVCILLGALIILEMRNFKFTPPRPTPLVDQEQEPEDEDVADEALRVQGEVEDLVSVCNVRKHYGALKAVRGISFGIQENECFGLLGPNGAGKSTTISMLTREIQPSFGDIKLNKKSIWQVGTQQHYDEARLGCCFQTDGLCEYLTAKEHIQLYLNLRFTVTPNDSSTIVEAVLDRMRLRPYANR